MSLQKGNAQRSRAQKHQNRVAFSNSMHDTSRRTKTLNQLDIHGVCARCKEVIAWKIRYKKYKPLSAPRCCTVCRQRSVTAAYRTICPACATGGGGGRCEKCGAAVGGENLTQRSQVSPSERARLLQDLQARGRGLSERQRRSLRRRLADAEGLQTVQQVEEIRAELERLVATAGTGKAAGKDAWETDSDCEGSDVSGEDGEDSDGCTQERDDLGGTA